MANMTNESFGVLSTVFILSSMDLPREVVYVTIVIGIPIYVVSVVCNVLLILIIALNRTLHEPMYIFLCNLYLSDIIGISAMLPRTIFDIISDYRLITFLACFLQACCLHIYGGVTLIILSVMAFDRYVAICHPLRYHTLMSKNTVVHLILFSWIVVFTLVGILFALTLQYPFCRKDLFAYACDNMSILKLTCAIDITVNNIYGLFVAGFFHGICLFSVAYSYTFILVTCYKNKDSESRSKAWHTCGTHLTVFLLNEISSLGTILSYRFSTSSPTLQKITGLLYVIVHSMNPFIYGLKTNEIKSKVKNICKKLFGLKKVHHQNN